MTSPLVSQFFRRDARLRARFGVLYDRFFDGLHKTDPIADAVVGELEGIPQDQSSPMIRAALNHGIGSISNAGPALRSLFAHVDEVPAWVDWEQLDAGGAVLMRSGVLGCCILALRSLPLIYSSPAGNKPLIFSGRLRYNAARRLGQTGRFVYLTSQPGGLKRFADGFKVTVWVRLMHARIRHYLRKSLRWQAELWGEPINQSYMMLTNLLLSVGAMDGMESFGLCLSKDERNATLHLWRYSAYLLGLAPEMTFTSEAEARQMLELAMAVDGAPDKCSCLLVSALMDVSRTVHLGPARWFRDVCYGVSEALIGSERARALAYPQTAWRRLVPLMARISRAMNLVRPWVCGLDRVVQSVGAASWKKIIDMALEAGPPAFTRASRLHTAFLGSAKKSAAGLESVSYGCPETSQIPPVLVEMETHP